MMHVLTTLRAARSLIAGALVGASIVVTVFALTVADPSSTQTVLFIAAVVLVLGFTLQAVVTRHFGEPLRAGLAV
jgi:DMSO reductase anchor subunit